MNIFRTTINRASSSLAARDALVFLADVTR
jgi:hypothetical protein